MKKSYITSLMLTAIMAASMTGCGNNTVSENAQNNDITKTSVSYDSKADTQTSEDDDTAGIAKDSVENAKCELF